MNKKDYILIEQMLDNDLSAEGLRQLFERAKHDEELANYLLIAQEQQEWLVSKEEIPSGIQEKVSSAREQYNASKRRNRIFKFSLLVLVAIALAIALYQLKGIDSDYLQPLPIASRLSTDDIYEEARTLFNSGDYENALPLIESMIEGEQVELEWLRALGICQIDRKKYTIALNTFTNLANESELYINTANYYKGLIHYELEDTNLAQNLLEGVPEGTYYFSMAEKILKKIREDY